MSAPLQIGLVLFPRVTQLDFTGPLQVFSSIPDAQVHLVWKRIEPVPTDSVLMLTPTISFADCPQLDVVCVPGGFGADAMVNDQEMLAFLKKQAEGARLRPKMDVQCSRYCHGQDGEHDEAPAKRGTEHPLPPCRRTLRETEDLAERGAPFGDRLQDRESHRQQKEQEGPGKQGASGVKPETFGETAGSARGNRVRGEKPGRRGYKECKLQGALGAACGCRIERLQR